MNIILKHNGQPATVAIFLDNKDALELYSIMLTSIIQNIYPLKNPNAEVTVDYRGGITFEISYSNISNKAIASIDKALAFPTSSSKIKLNSNI